MVDISFLADCDCCVLCVKQKQAGNCFENKTSANSISIRSSSQKVSFKSAVAFSDFEQSTQDCLHLHLSIHLANKCKYEECLGNCILFSPAHANAGSLRERRSLKLAEVCGSTTRQDSTTTIRSDHIFLKRVTNLMEVKLFLRLSVLPFAFRIHLLFDHSFLG